MSETDSMEKDTIQGLSSAQVEERRARGQINGDTEVKTKSVRRIIREHSLTLFNVINVILALAVALVGSFKNMLFMGIVISNTLIGVVQEIRSKRMVDKLSIMVASGTEVIRDGEIRMISPREIVKDDVLHLKRGAQIPVDACVVSGSLQVNESLVTGEPDLIVKYPGDDLISGSFVSGGDAYVRAVRVGKECFAAGISRDARTVKKAESEIVRTLNRIVKIISLVLLPLGVLLFYNQYLTVGSDLKDVVVSVAAALVTMIPEGLMLLTSSVMAVAVIRLSGKKVLVQQMYCIETLARVDVLCLDKTGTITSGRMKVKALLPFEGCTQPECDEGFRLLSAVTQDEGATTEALKNCFGVDSTVKADRVIPFSSEKKYSGAEFAGVTYIMGAGEMIFGDGFRPLEDQIRDRIGTFRVIALAESSFPFGPEGELPAQLRPMGALLIEDEIRPEAADTIRYFTDQGVLLKVISGDSAETVSHIAAAAGVPCAEMAVDARMLRTEQEIEAGVEQYTVFGRVTPAQKRAFVRALQKQGHTVAMTGDGVNDVLAMKEADCSVAMASGSDAARNVAQLVLTTDDFSTMPEVVAEGRRSINNIQRSSSLFLTKTIFAILNSILFTFAALQYPFEPIQMSYISALTIGFPSFVLALQPNRERVSGSFFLNIMTGAISGGVTMFAGLLLTYLFGHFCSMSMTEISMTCVLVTAFTLVCVLIRISIPFDWVRAVLLGAVLIGLTAGGFWLHGLLGFVPLTLVKALTAAGIGCINAALYFFLFGECEKLRGFINRKYPDEYLKEQRRKKMEKKAFREAAHLRYAEERRSALRYSSKGYQGLVRAAAAPIARVALWIGVLRQKFHRDE